MTLRPARFIQPPQSESGPFKTMTSKDAEEYMIYLSQTGDEELSGIEKQVELTLRNATLQRADLLKRIEQTHLQISQAEKESEQLLGQINAYTFILQKAEDERRWKRSLTEVEEEKEG